MHRLSRTSALLAAAALSAGSARAGEFMPAQGKYVAGRYIVAFDDACGSDKAADSPPGDTWGWPAHWIERTDGPKRADARPITDPATARAARHRMQPHRRGNGRVGPRCFHARRILRRLI